MPYSDKEIPDLTTEELIDRIFSSIDCSNEKGSQNGFLFAVYFMHLIKLRAIEPVYIDMYKISFTGTSRQ